MEVELDYKTVQSHIDLLLENGVIYTPKKGYGQIFFISPEWEENEILKEVLSGENDGKPKGKTRKSKK